MARNTTRQGANFELSVMADLHERGYTCLRSSGSRGAVDVIAVSTERPGAVLFIQCKITKPVIPPAERFAVQSLAVAAGALPLVAFKTRYQGSDNRHRTAISYRELTGPGPKEWREWVPPEQTKENGADE